MKAMILAAGRGERMRPLTDHCPKPLLSVAGKPLIEHHIRALADAGITDIVINHAWLGEQIVDFCGDGSRWGVAISYSNESHGALETAGGIINALPLLSATDQPFLVINADIFCAINFSQLPTLADEDLAHLWLVDNPSHHPKGDFSLLNGRLAPLQATKKQVQHYTFSGIGLYRPAFFQPTTLQQVLPLAPLLRQYALQNKLSASVLSSYWFDIGTPERLQQINQLFS